MVGLILVGSSSHCVGEFRGDVESAAERWFPGEVGWSIGSLCGSGVCPACVDSLVRHRLVVGL